MNSMQSPINKFFNYISSNKELAIVIIIIFVLMMMVVPLNTVIMDSIIAFNITVTVLVLMVVLYMQSAVGLSSFPSILLVLTLIRIGITVSTSRLILLDGDAGEIVQTFGEFVVGGNLVVGMIVFVIVTIINFIVITKGSERVAEVGARFSLDAMPGKQMSIDSDLKAGNITMEQANSKRKILGLESKLYGAMDGAMKFVKGDAIASIIDVLVNLVGGLIIGIVQKGMTFSTAAATYSILTVGDGLVQQLPGLLISLTAGVMITRVSDEDEQQNLGQNILTQVFSDYRAVFSACALLVGMAFIPGMPSIVFVIFICIFAIIGFVIWKKGGLPGAIGGRETKGDAVVEESEQKRDITTTEQVQMQMLPLVLYFSPKLRNSEKLKQLKEVVVAIRQQIANDIGVVVPQIIIKYDGAYQEDQYQLLVFEIPEVSGSIYWDRILVCDNEAAELIGFDNKIDNTQEFGEKVLGFWVLREKYQEICDKHKVLYLTCEQFLLRHIKFYISKHLAEFLGIQEVKNILDKMQEYQELIKELLRMLPLNKITEVFQRLIAEDISLRNFKVILDTMLEWGQREKDAVLITEHVRKALGRYIAYKFSKGAYLFSCIVLSHELEDVIRDSIRYSDTGSYLALDPRISDMIVVNTRAMLEQALEVKNVVIICHFDIRRYVRSITEQEFSYLPVLSFQELEGYTQYNSLGVLEVN